MLRTTLILAGIAATLTLGHADDFVVIRTSVPETQGLTCDHGLAADASFTVQRLGPEETEELGQWRGATRQVIELAGVAAAALVVSPAR